MLGKIPRGTVKKGSFIRTSHVAMILYEREKAAVRHDYGHITSRLNRDQLTTFLCVIKDARSGRSLVCHIDGKEKVQPDMTGNHQSYWFGILMIDTEIIQENSERVT